MLGVFENFQHHELLQGHAPLSVAGSDVADALLDYLTARRCGC
jgi:hypothetical protein